MALFMIKGVVVKIQKIHNHGVKKSLINRLMRKAFKKCLDEDLWGKKISIEDTLDHFVSSNLVDIRTEKDWSKCFLAVRSNRKTISIMTTKKMSKTNKIMGVFVFEKNPKKENTVFCKIITSFYGENVNIDEFRLGVKPSQIQSGYWSVHALSMYGENLTSIYDGDPREFIKRISEGADKEELIGILGSKKKKSWVYKNRKSV
jgi:hypothetical protein